VADPEHPLTKFVLSRSFSLIARFTKYRYCPTIKNVHFGGMIIMFKRESEMTASVIRWMRLSGLQTRREFITPWGICDLVGVALNRKRVDHRLRLKQTKSISSITRAALLLTVPEVETTNSISLDRLKNNFGNVIPEEVVVSEVERLITDRFVLKNKNGRLQKQNGWLPLYERLVAVELKLSRIDEAFQQATANLGFAQESFVAFPIRTAERITDGASKWSRYIQEGIGVLGVGKRSCRLLVPSRPLGAKSDPAIQLYCVEKFWRSQPRS
jgi:hypothetical protein